MRLNKYEKSLLFPIDEVVGRKYEKNSLLKLKQYLKKIIRYSNELRKVKKSVLKHKNKV